MNDAWKRLRKVNSKEFEDFEKEVREDRYTWLRFFPFVLIPIVIAFTPESANRWVGEREWVKNLYYDYGEVIMSYIVVGAYHLLAARLLRLKLFSLSESADHLLFYLSWALFLVCGLAFGDVSLAFSLLMVIWIAAAPISILRTVMRNTKKG